MSTYECSENGPGGFWKCCYFLKGLAHEMCVFIVLEMTLSYLFGKHKTYPQRQTNQSGLSLCALKSYGCVYWAGLQWFKCLEHRRSTLLLSGPVFHASAETRSNKCRPTFPQPPPQWNCIKNYLFGGALRSPQEEPFCSNLQLYSIFFFPIFI